MSNNLNKQTANTNETSTTAPEVETVLVRFRIPELVKLPGVDSAKPSIAVLLSNAAMLTEQATKLSKDTKEVFAKFVATLGECGRKLAKTEAHVDFQATNGTKLTVPQTVAFANGMISTVRLLTTGAIVPNKFKELTAVIPSILKQLKAYSGDANTDNAGYADNVHSETADGSKFYAEIKTIGVDSSGKIAMVYELLFKAASFVLAKDELAAVAICDKLAKATNIPADNFVSLTQLVVNGMKIAEIRQVAKSYADKAEELRKAETAQRYADQHTADITRLEHRATVNAH